MAKRRRRAILLSVVFVTVAAVLLILLVRYRRIAPDVISETDTGTLTIGVDEARPRLCVSENGILYGKNQLIYYVDLATKTEYVLCDEINCTHLTSRCSARYGDKMRGLAQHGNRIYLFDQSMNGDCRLIRMDTSGNQRKTLAEFPQGDFTPGSRYLYYVYNAYYCGNYAWAELYYGYMEEDGKETQQIQCVAVDLESGEVTELTPLEDIGVRYQFVAITEDYVMIYKGWNEHSADAMEAYLLYDVKEQKLTQLEENPQHILYNADGTLNGTMPKYSFYGSYEGDFLFSEMDWDSFIRDMYHYDTIFQVWDPKTNQKEVLCTLENGGPMSVNDSDMSDNVFDGDQILIMEYQGTGDSVGEMDVEICLLHLSDGSMEMLFEDTSQVEFPISGWTSDSFIGTTQRSEDLYSPTDVYVIQKEDYYQGKTDRAEYLFTLSAVD